GEGADQNKRPVRSSDGQLDCHRSSQRAAVEQDTVGRHLLNRGEPIIGGVGGGVAARLGRFTVASAVPRVIENEHGAADLLLPAHNAGAAVTQVARVSVTEKNRSLLGLPAFGRTP